MDKNKLLTVSIAAYNVENYLKRALESCIVASMDNLEVIIVNDGSTDSTSEIAHEFQRLYPDTFIVIDKENGGYGTTVNASMNIARGKYFRLLDGDDWFNSAGLEALLGILANTEEDWLVNDYIKSDAIEGDSIVEAGPERLKGKTLSIEEVGVDIRPSMWYSTFKTSIYKEHPFTLPSHTLYTDALFVANHIAHAKTVRYLNEVLYCYRTNSREEQSTSAVSRRKHVDEEILVYENVLAVACREDVKLTGPLLLRVQMSEFNVVNTTMCCEMSIINREKIIQAEELLRSKCPDAYVYSGELSGVLRLLRNTSYMSYFPLKLLKWPR